MEHGAEKRETPDGIYFSSSAAGLIALPTRTYVNYTFSPGHYIQLVPIIRHPAQVSDNTIMATQKAKVRRTMEEAAAAELLIVEDTEHRRIEKDYI